MNDLEPKCRKEKIWSKGKMSTDMAETRKKPLGVGDGARDIK
jgi:hypothetical protein